MMRLADNPGSVGGGILGKTSLSSSSRSHDDDDDDDDLRVSTCLVAIDVAKSVCRPVLWYGFNPNEIFNKEEEKKKTDFYRKRGRSGDGKQQQQQQPQPPPELPLGLRDLTPVLESELIPNSSMIVALGSCVYLLGRVPKGKGKSKAKGEVWDEEEKEEARHVFYFDTNCPLKGWVRGPDMINGRGNSVKAVALEGKIYVFGGNVDGDFRTKTIKNDFAEVLDPIKEKWEALPLLPECAYREFPEGFNHYSSLPPVAYDCGGEGKKIFVGGNRYIYCVNSNTWGQLPGKLWDLMMHIYDNLVGVGCSLYWTVEQTLYALNMETEKLDSTSIKGYRPINPHPVTCQCCDIGSEYSILLHLGGNMFCSLAVDHLYRPQGPVRTKVRFSKLQVSKRDGGSIKASIVRHQTHIFDGELHFPQAYVLLLLSHTTVTLAATMIVVGMDTKPRWHAVGMRGIGFFTVDDFTGKVVTTASMTAGGKFLLKIEKHTVDSVEHVEANYLLIASGSSRLVGYTLATQLGHSIIDPVPSLFTFKIEDPQLAELSRVSFPKVRAKLKLETVGPMLVTHWGLSGPVILQLSAWGARDLFSSDYRGTLFVDFIPDLHSEDVKSFLIEHKNQFVVLNVDGITGGFNFQNAWSGGYIAGKSIGNLTVAAGLKDEGGVAVWGKERGRICSEEAEE
ncbi:hypothetical protein RHGRI_001950 [Rhododendron griersonianum]|uniref:RsdA/BaiN/AoA(So)-like insert domain-containing protein n=1 Tax=Rhododendron griersonianum TaxID=479676 RepID=A0AAV6LQA6_9ERIC|nr:hypothetical protein RHGRI_001950 [Rhododendron griersonianum]